MAYNLEFLVHILEQILHPDHHHRGILDPNKKPQIESLLEKAYFLKELFDDSSPAWRIGEKIESLESRIRDAAHEAEDVLESHLVDRILSVREGVSFTICPPDLQQVIGEFDAAKEETMRIMDGSQIPETSLPSASSKSDPNPKTILVGISKDLIQLMRRLTGQQSKLEIIPIVGMGGIGSDSSHHQMELLNEVESWNLLHERVFAKETCPPELEQVGKKIANNCRGLPLAIHVIGGILSQGKRTQESWVQVAKDVSSVVSSQDEQISKILSLSYNHLPNYLKPCFLYMGAFPEDYEIRASKLIRLWAAEGFLKPIAEKSLEEAAQVYLKALVDRNLIFVRQQETKGNVKSYSIHDLLRDLCMRKAHQEKLLYVVNRQRHNLRVEDVICLRRVSAHSSVPFRDDPFRNYGLIAFMKLARSYIFTGYASGNILSPLIFASRLLRVLDVLGITFHELPEGMLQLVNLRYLAFTSRSHLPPSKSIYWNLQTLIFQRLISHPWRDAVAYEIFDMPRFIRHIKFRSTFPRFVLTHGKSCVLENLQTLSTITLYEGFDRVLESIPNLKKLGIYCNEYRVSYNTDLTCLRKLETLKGIALSPRYYLRHLTFPPSVKKLTLSDCRILSGNMNKIGNLPNLEVLKLRDCFFQGREWEPTEGEFCQLQFLLLEKVNLVNWVADETHFRRLQCLIIRYCYALEEIPCGIGEIPTLEKIEVNECSPSTVASVRKIQEEQLENGNDGLQVLIN